MVLHGGQANLTKDESSQVSQFMSSRPWSQFGTGASCGGSGGSGSGSSASSTPAVVTSSSALPKAISDAPVKLSWASVQHDIKETKVVQERLGRDKKDQKSMILWRMPSLSFQRQNACLDNASLPSMTGSLLP